MGLQVEAADVVVVVVVVEDGLAHIILRRVPLLLIMHRH
tara:strand:- start:426 stop:542 length:117 start_codon:yes stop_codon:yes gene_type:complete